MHIQQISLVCHVFVFMIMKSKSAEIPKNDVVVKSGLVVKDKLREGGSIFTKISDEFEKKYRSVGAVSDFSKVVVGMMDSLKDLETKGDEMVKKISTQEARLESVLQEISAKEEYVNVVNKKVKERENIFTNLQSNIREGAERKQFTEEETLRNSNKIKAQEVRLKRLLKDISTKVSYVNVVDSKIKEMESKIEGVTKTLELLEEEKGKHEKTVQDLQGRRSETKQQLQRINQDIFEKESLQKEEKDQYKKEMQDYNDSISRMKEEMLQYERNIAEANSTLSGLEKSANEILPVENKIVSTEILYPAFALSLLFNVVIGGKMLSEVPSTIQKLSTDLMLEDQDVNQTIQYGPSMYEEENYNDMEDNQNINPILQLEKIKREKEHKFGKKSDYDFLRRSDYQDLAYSYK